MIKLEYENSQMIRRC